MLIHESQQRNKNKWVCSSAYAYVYVTGVLTCLCLCYAYACACAYAYAKWKPAFSFSPVVIDSLIDYTQLFTFNLYWLTFRIIIARKKVLYIKILQ